MCLHLEAPSTLLVHLGAGRGAVDGEVEEAARAHDGEDRLDVGDDPLKNLLLRLRRRPILWVETRVDDTVEVEVEIVHLRTQSGCSDASCPP